MFYLGFGTNPKVFRYKIINWITKSKYSHSWIEFTDKSNTRCVMHANERGIVISSVQEVYERCPDYILFRSFVDLSPGFRIMKKFLGKKYAFTSAIWNGFLLLLTRIIPEKLLMWLVVRDQETFTCSELVANIIKISGVLGSEKLDPEITTTGQLVKFCEESFDFQKL